MITFQRIRSILFYLSLFLFFGLLPFIIFFALGYKFNTQTLKFVKTGLIYIKTQPEKAKIYLNGKIIPKETPASLEELIPGVYKISLELEQHYPWKGEVYVEASKASRLDKIILFPLKPNLEQLSQREFTNFRINFERKLVYYLDQKEKVVYRSNLDASNFEDIASLPEEFLQINHWEVCADNKKMFIFNPHQLGVIFFDIKDDYEYTNSLVFLEYPREKIINVFWHSDNYHLIILTNKHIQVIESSTLAMPVNLIDLNQEELTAFYDDKEDILYFSDLQKSSDGSFHNNLYKLDLSSAPYLFRKFISQPFGSSKSQETDASK